MTGLVMITKGGGCAGGGNTKSPAIGHDSTTDQEERNQLSVLEFLISALRKSMVSCRVDRRGGCAEDVISAMHHQMEIGWPTNVQHIAHVTFDRFNGFLGLPVEFEVEIPCKVPSASASVFGVSAESMQCSYDSKGNSVPTILLLMQERLYSQGGLKKEGIFRINPENSQEKHVRDQLNRGIVPDDIDVHCLAGLIKTWFRELPSGVLDGLSPEQVLNCNSEEDYTELVKQLKPTEAGLLRWAIDLMVDVVEEEEFNKMNARNIAMVFSPNMTQMSDPLTALMHAVQVMNLLKTLITRTLRERYDDDGSGSGTDVSDGSSHSSTGENSPVSSRSSSEEDYDDDITQEEMMEVSCDDTASDFDQLENSDDGNTYDIRGVEDEEIDKHEDGHEEEAQSQSLSEIEELFLRHLDQLDQDDSIAAAVITTKEVVVVEEVDTSSDKCNHATKDLVGVEEDAELVISSDKCNHSISTNKEQPDFPVEALSEEAQRSVAAALSNEVQIDVDPSLSSTLEEEGFRDVEMVENSADPPPAAASSTCLMLVLSS